VDRAEQIGYETISKPYCLTIYQHSDNE